MGRPGNGKDIVDRTEPGGGAPPQLRPESVAETVTDEFENDAMAEQTVWSGVFLSQGIPSSVTIAVR